MQYVYNKPEAAPKVDHPPTIATNILQRATAFRDEQRSALRNIQCVLRKVLKQRDTCATYALHLEGRVEGLHQDAANVARERVAEVCVLKEQNVELRTNIEDQATTLRKERQAQVDLQRQVETVRVTLATLQHERVMEQEAFELASRKMVELKERNDHLQQANLELASRAEILGEDVAKSDQKAAALKKQTEADHKRIRVENEQREKQMEETTKKLANLHTDHHKLSDILEAKNKHWLEQYERVARETQFAKAETTNNHQNFQDILVSKDAEITQLSETVAAIKEEGNHTKTVQRLVQNVQSQRKTMAERNQKIKEMKTDIQNLLDTKQQDTAKLTTYLKENQELRAERSAATDEVARLQGELERRKKFVMTLQKIIEGQAINAEALCDERCIPEAVVKKMMADAVFEYYVEKETAVTDLRGAQKKSEDLQSKYNTCEDELFKHRVEEEFRQGETRRLTFEVSLLKQDQQLLQEQLEVCNQYIYAPKNSDSASIQQLYTLINAKVYTLQVQNRQLLATELRLTQELEETKSTLQDKLAKLERKAASVIDTYTDLDTLYWDVAVHQHDQLHEELAKYKQKCGEEHYFKSYPSSRLVHERRMLQFALMYDSEGINKSKLPREYYDPAFMQGFHPATALALRKLWPDLWQFHVDKAAWIEPTVNLLTENGEINMDENARAASNGRLEAFKKELEVLDQQLHQRRRNMRDLDWEPEHGILPGTCTGPDREDGTSSSSSSSSDAHELEDSSDEPQALSPEDTDHTSDTSSSEALKLLFPEEPEISDLEYNTSTSELMTMDEYDALPAFAKKIAARVSTQEKELKHIAGWVPDEDIDEEAFLAKHGQALHDESQPEKIPTPDGCETNAVPDCDNMQWDFIGDTTLVQHDGSTTEGSDVQYDEEAENFYTRWEFEQLDCEQKKRYKEILAVEGGG